ncbi:hypothetical protein GCM10011608_53520 [Micromonospora sonchi]|uniref:Terpene synthase n=1 Tax=Micromonospora sonchi TaxID=1763543 RepID=A0A917U6X9_9ACTN|nr:terpene synthase family protein [Micromonospora sonchi]GGM61698.1 hypothetical protein GCM10011608_53520 [Micromonospora sonchi]
MNALTGISPGIGDDQMSAAAEQGRICALAAKGQRDLAGIAASHPDLFPGRPFDAALFSTVAMTVAFNAPWRELAQLRLTNRAVLWAFAVDWLIDHEARSRDEIDGLTARCLAVIDGDAPEEGDLLGAFTAEMRDELAAAPAFAAYRECWREESRKVLAAMAREWSWKQNPGRLPSLDDYVDNSANLASTVVNVVHWMHSDDAATLRHLDALLATSDQVQRILRLVNDVATYERDLRWGDLNALLLVPRVDVERRIVELVAQARRMLEPLHGSCPVEANYLARQLGFSSGFYQSTDFWGVS